MKGFDRELMEREAEFVRRLVEQMESNSNEYSALVKSNEVIDDIFKLIKYLIYKEVETSGTSQTYL
jgi:NADH:ubiquinone oxidoreductase subunit D